MPPDIPIELQRSWVLYLEVIWERINRRELNNQLRAPTFALDEASSRLGRWEATSRTIGISTEHLLTATWLDVELTVRHEMAHQIVCELFDSPHAPPHGQLFARACAMLKIDSSPRAAAVEIPPETQRVLDRVRKLMKLGQSPNPHEAQAAVAAANRLLLRHNVDLADAEQGAKRAAGHTWRWLGRPRGRVGLDHRLISSILNEHFFVSCVWVRTSRPADDRDVRVLEVMGSPHNLDLAEYVHAYLHRTLDDLWARYRAARAAGSRRGGNALRNEYRVGVLMGFRDHLREVQVSAREEEGLVWLGDPALEEFVSYRYPRLRTMRRSSYRHGDAHDAGRADGRELRIRPGMGTSAVAVRRGRALPPAPAHADAQSQKRGPA